MPSTTQHKELDARPATGVWRRGTAALLVLMALAACRTPRLGTPPRRTHLDRACAIPFQWRGSVPLVEVLVGSAGPFRFLVDTGTGHVILSSDCSRVAGLETMRHEGMVGGVGGAMTAEIERTWLPRRVSGGRNSPRCRVS